jgi:uncharacterized protein YkwD
MEPPKKSKLPVIAAGLGIFLAVILLLLIIENVPFGNFLSPGQTTSTFVQYPSGGEITNATNIQISYPSNYQTLTEYALSMINQNRTSDGLNPVTLSPIPSGQQHADSMLQYGYFSHWDTQGFKPYMRYSLLNGTGYVEENVAYEYTSFPSFVSTQSVEHVIGDLEWQMMNNDSLCCNNGHRDNILNQYHNRVSIGIAYSSTYVYFVEDFETYLATLNSPITQGATVTISGNTSETLDPSSVQIFYDPTPTNLSASTLTTDFSMPYNQGTFAGGVVPPCNEILQTCQRFGQGVTVAATTWQVGSNSIDIQFSLSDFIAKSGNGVYTVYLVQGQNSNPEYLTSISVFI